jgi:hypothetical protein
MAESADPVRHLMEGGSLLFHSKPRTYDVTITAQPRGARGFTYRWDGATTELPRGSQIVRVDVKTAYYPVPLGFDLALPRDANILRDMVRALHAHQFHAFLDKHGYDRSGQVLRRGATFGEIIND